MSVAGIALRTPFWVFTGALAVVFPFPPLPRRHPALHRQLGLHDRAHRDPHAVRVTGEDRYLAQASLFVDRRGRHLLAEVEWGRAYQDETAIRDATVLSSHAVRAGYLTAGAIDVAVEAQDAELLDALLRQWSATVAWRTYITGGPGSQHQDDGLGEDWALTRTAPTRRRVRPSRR